MKQFESNFEYLMKYLSRLIPIVSVVTSGLLVGAETISVESINIPISWASYITLIVLAGIYFQCIRSASTLLNSIETSYELAGRPDYKKFATSNINTVFLRGESRIYNPFFYTSDSLLGSNSFSNYIGLLLT